MPGDLRNYAGKPAQIGGVTIIPLEQDERRCYRTDKLTVTCFASKKATGIVIASKHGNRAVDINGGDISMEHCLEYVDGLKDVLENLCFDK